MNFAPLDESILADHVFELVDRDKEILSAVLFTFTGLASREGNAETKLIRELLLHATNKSTFSSAARANNHKWLVLGVRGEFLSLLSRLENNLILVDELTGGFNGGINVARVGNDMR